MYSSFTQGSSAEEQLIQKTFGIKLNEDELRFVLESKTESTKNYEFLVTKFGAYIFNRTHRLVLVPEMSDEGVLCFQFEEQKIKKERERIRKSCIVKCFEACFFPNYKDALYLEIIFKDKSAMLSWFHDEQNISVVDRFEIKTF